MITSSSAADTVDPQDSPEFAPLFAQGGNLNVYTPVGNAKSKQGVADLDIHIIEIPSNLGSARGSKTDTSTGPAYIREKLWPMLQAGGANVTGEVIPVENLTRGVTVLYGRENVRNANKITIVMMRARDQVYKAIIAGKIPIVLGGDHSSFLSIAGTLMAYPDLRVAFKDAHPDYLGEPEKGQQGNAHGRTVSTLQGIGPDPLMPVMDGVPKLQAKNTLFIGTHHPDKAEASAVHQNKCPTLDLDTLAKYPALSEKFLQEFVQGHPFHWSFDPDVLSKSVLMSNHGVDMHPGAPMATLEGLSSNTFFRLCRVLSLSKGKLVSMESSETALLCDTEQGGLTRDHVVGGILRTLGAGDPEYYVDYDAFAE